MSSRPPMDFCSHQHLNELNSQSLYVTVSRVRDKTDRMESNITYSCILCTIHKYMFIAEYSVTIHSCVLITDCNVLQCTDTSSSSLQ